MITILGDVVDRMCIEDVVTAVKDRNHDAKIHHHTASNSYVVIKSSYAAVGVASRLGNYCASENDAWRSAMKEMIEEC